MVNINFEDWVKATYQSCENPDEFDGHEKECCKDCESELEIFDGQEVCYFCKVCDDCKEFKDECQCLKE